MRYFFSIICIWSAFLVSSTGFAKKNDSAKDFKVSLKEVQDSTNGWALNSANGETGTCLQVEDYSNFIKRMTSELTPLGLKCADSVEELTKADASKDSKTIPGILCVSGNNTLMTVDWFPGKEKCEKYRKSKLNKK